MVNELGHLVGSAIGLTRFERPVETCAPTRWTVVTSSGKLRFERQYKGDATHGLAGTERRPSDGRVQMVAGY